MVSIIWERFISIGGRSRENFADNRFALLFIYIDYHYYALLIITVQYSSDKIMCEGYLLLYYNSNNK